MHERHSRSYLMSESAGRASSNGAQTASGPGRLPVTT
jgi:hypothetical protein